MAWAALAVGCAWAGVLAAALFRTTALGVAAVLAVPLLVVPAVRMLLGGREAGEVADAGSALWSVTSGVSQDGDGSLSRALRFAGQPFFLALALSLTALIGAYTASALSRPAPRPPANCRADQPNCPANRQEGVIRPIKRQLSGDERSPFRVLFSKALKAAASASPTKDA